MVHLEVPRARGAATSNPHEEVLGFGGGTSGWKMGREDSAGGWGVLRHEGEKGWRKKPKAYSFQHSKVVFHPTTSQSQPCLASKIRVAWL